MKSKTSLAAALALLALNAWAITDLALLPVVAIKKLDARENHLKAGDYAPLVADFEKLGEKNRGPEFYRAEARKDERAARNLKIAYRVGGPVGWCHSILDYCRKRR